MQCKVFSFSPPFHPLDSVDSGYFFFLLFDTFSIFTYAGVMGFDCRSGLGFVCFAVLNPRVLLANRVVFFFCFRNCLISPLFFLSHAPVVNSRRVACS